MAPSAEKLSAFRASENYGNTELNANTFIFSYMPSPNSLRVWIQICRSNFGSAPRRIGFFERRALKTPPPQWMLSEPDDQLWQLYRDRDILLREGVVVWGHLIQANRLLFSPGAEDHPCAALYSFDPFFDDNPGLLEELGHSLYRLKGKKVADPKLQRIADYLENELERTLSMPVPSLSEDGPYCVHSSMMVHRAHLPDGVLSNGMFPVIAHPTATPTAMILPSKFWPEEMQRLWKLM